MNVLPRAAEDEIRLPAVRLLPAVVGRIELVDVDDEELRHTIGSQREQLELLGTRIRQLMATNQELTLANKKTYQDLETAVRKVVPLRKQIDELQSLQETLQRYIRTKYERTFSMRKLRE